MNKIFGMHNYETIDMTEENIIYDGVFRNCEIYGNNVAFDNCNFIDCEFNIIGKRFGVHDCYFSGCDFYMYSLFPTSIEKTTFRECNTDHIYFYLGCATLKELDIDREMTDKFLIHAVSAMSAKERIEFFNNPVQYITESKFFDRFPGKSHMDYLFSKKGYRS